MDRQMLRDGVHRFTEHGPERLLDRWSKDPAPGLSAEHRAEIAPLVEIGLDRAVHGRLAHDPGPRHPEEHHDGPAAAPRPGAEPGRKHLAVPTPKPTLEPGKS
jgi:hypothetical protein